MNDEARRSTSPGGRRSHESHDVNELVRLVYARLRRLAGAYLRNERRGHTLSPSDLVHDVYLRLAAAKGLEVAGKTHFLALAAREMRRVLREHAQKRAAVRHGGGLTRVSLPDDLAGSERPLLDVLALEEFLDRTARRSPRRAKVIEMKVFGGMTEEEMSVVLGVTVRTVRADLAAGRARLAQYFGRKGSDGSR
jgi:RNA polymerase sigma factor (TIGR02999 family)